MDDAMQQSPSYRTKMPNNHPQGLKYLKRSTLLRHGQMAGGGRRGCDAHLKLLGVWSSPFVIRVRVVLHLKGLSYEYVEEDLSKKSHLLLTNNPVHKKVPVLIHDGKPISESQVIVQYIDETLAGNGPSILPADPYERAVARFWASYVDDKLFSAWIPVYSAKTRDERVEAAKQVSSVLETFEQAFKECSKGKAFFGGDSVGYADVALGGFLGWLNASEAMCGVKLIDAAKTPLLAAWAECFCALDAAKEVIPDVERLVEYNKMRRDAIAAAAESN